MILDNYFQRLYKHTIKKAAEFASDEINKALSTGGSCLDCGANTGLHFNKFNVDKNNYYGIEWDRDSVATAQKKGLNIIEGDLNKPLPYENNTFQCVFALSVLEHLLNGCLWMKEAKRVLKPKGKLVILTPNISTFFTIFLLLLGRMPSSGPHPDSKILLENRVATKAEHMDVEKDTPVHRHLVVFSYKELNKYLTLIGFKKITGHGFGLYPFPIFSQPFFERIDPYHCHQMVFTALK